MGPMLPFWRHIMKNSLFILSLLLCGNVPVLGLAAEYDVVVYGGTSAGVIAAVQAKKMGKSVVIVCPDKHLGGLSSGGLGFTDTGNKAVIGGLSREFYHRVWKHYDQPGGLEVAEAARSTATRARARRPSTASSARCGSSSRTSPSRSSRTASGSTRSPCIATSGSTARRA